MPMKEAAPALNVLRKTGFLFSWRILLHLFFSSYNEAVNVGGARDIATR